MVINEINDSIMIFQGNLDPEKGEQYLTAIVSLGWVALVADKLPDQFAVHIKNLVSRKIVKELLMKDRLGKTTHEQVIYMYSARLAQSVENVGSSFTLSDRSFDSRNQ